MKRMTSDEVKAVTLDLLKQFADFCDKNNLKYILDCGTLIGAIRHKGFIPWDDDIDVAMPYPDYEKFIQLFENSTDQGNVELLYGMKRNVGLHFTKMTDKRTIVVSPGRDKKRYMSVWIDIFPMFALSDDDTEALEQVNSIESNTRKSWNYMKLPSVKHPIRFIYSKLFYDYKLRKCMEAQMDIVKRYPYGSTKRVRIVSVLTRNALNCVSPDIFDDLINVEFEGMKFKAPRIYDEYLTQRYGDYMKLPPKEKQVGHLVEAYWK